MFLCHFVKPDAWIDLQIILGDSRSELSRVFTYMMNILYKRYAPLVSDIHVWKDYFPSFADHMNKLGMSFDDTLGFLDGKCQDQQFGIH